MWITKTSREEYTKNTFQNTGEKFLKGTLNSKRRSNSFSLLCCREFLVDICMDFFIHLDAVLEGW